MDSITLETAASLAHQIRTPLSSALLYASNLKRQQISDEDRIKVSEKIFSRLRHLEELVNNMLMYARGMSVIDESFIVSEVLTELQQILEPQLRTSNTRMQVDNSTGNETIQGNRQMFLSALINLCVNAIQAMGRNGKLQITASSENEILLLNVCDNGPGIRDEEIHRVFEPFFTTRENGTGLGLAVVKAIVTAHKGELGLESKADEGCCFSIRIPLFRNTDK